MVFPPLRVCWTNGILAAEMYRRRCRSSTAPRLKAAGVAAAEADRAGPLVRGRKLGATLGARRPPHRRGRALGAERQHLRLAASVAVYGYALTPGAVGLVVGGLHVLDGGRLREVDRLRHRVV